jgi:hypothetical protein
VIKRQPSARLEALNTLKRRTSWGDRRGNFLNSPIQSRRMLNRLIPRRGAASRPSFDAHANSSSADADALLATIASALTDLREGRELAQNSPAEELPVRSSAP